MNKKIKVLMCMFFLTILNCYAQTKEKEILPNFSGKSLEFVKPYSVNCTSNDDISFSADNASFNIVGLYSLYTDMKKVSEDKYELYFILFARIIPISKSLQKQKKYISETKPVAEIIIKDENSIDLKWFGFYNKKTKKYFSTQNPFNPKQNPVILNKCKE